MIQTTPLAERLKIVLVGVRNAGKSSLLNAITGQETAIVSDTPGTTTDPVTRTMEIGLLGPVAITDTAGFDDTGELGLQRVKKTQHRLSAGDVAVFVTANHLPLSDEEKKLFQSLKSESRIPYLVVLTHADHSGNAGKRDFFNEESPVYVDNNDPESGRKVCEALVTLRNRIQTEASPLEGLVKENDFILLVTPVDLAAPKGRLILPQVETIRDCLDRDAACMIVKERELHSFYRKLPEKPRLVITDSQAFHKVAADVSPDQPLTSFSILFAHKKGNLRVFYEGLAALEKTPRRAKIMILENCKHHQMPDDIATVKIPRLFKQLIHTDVEFIHSRQMPSGKELEDLYMIIHCGGCMATRQVIQNRITAAVSHGVFITNFGLFLAWANGLIPRAILPFESAGFL